MKITVEGLFHGKHLPLRPGNFELFLDGKRIDYVLESDPDEGWVTYYDKDKNGNMMLSDEGEVQTVTKHGKIELRMRDE